MDDNGQRRVTLALLGERMEQMLKRQDRIESKVDTLDTKIDHLTECDQVREERWIHHEKVHDRLAEEHAETNRMKNLQDVGAYILAIIAAIVGVKVNP